MFSQILRDTEGIETTDNEEWAMDAKETLHVLLLDKDNAVTSVATDACEAVEQHFRTLDDYCPPANDFNVEETSVTVFSIPRALEHRLVEDVDDMDNEALADAIQRLAEEDPEISREMVSFSYRSGELKVSPVESKP